MSNWNLISHLFSQTSTSSFSTQLLKDKTTNTNRSKPGPKPGSLAASKKRQSSDNNNKKATGTLPPTSSSTSNTNTLTTTTQPIKKKLSVQQAAVNDMMKRALEEDKYSALGSVVNVNSDDSSDDDDEEGDTNNEVEEEDEDDIRWNHRPKRSNSSSSDVADKPWGGNSMKEKIKVDRTTLQLALRKHIRLESQKSVRNFEERTFFTDAEDYLVSGSSTRNASKHSRSMSPMRNGVDGIPDGDLAIDGRRIGKRRKKKKKKGAVAAAAAAAAGQQQIDVPMESSGADNTPMTDKSGNDDEWENNNAGTDNNGEDVEFVAQEEEESIFGQTQGSSNATWVECDRCKKVSG